MLTLNQRSYLCDFLIGFVPETYDTLWDLTAKLDDSERKYLLMLCYKKQGDMLKIVVNEKLTKYGVKV